MAFITCPKCNKMISDMAPSCPHCDHSKPLDESALPDKTEQPKKPSLPEGCGCGLLLFGIIMVFVFIGIFSNPGPDEIGAYTASQWFVEKRLKAPGTADFPVYIDSFVTDLGGGKFKVESYVDAENSFGAKLRTQYTCIVRADGSGWKLEKINIH